MFKQSTSYSSHNDFHLEDYSSEEEFVAPDIEPGLDYWHEKTERYFEKIINQFRPAHKENKNPGLIVVVHPVPTLPAFIKALQKIGPIRHIIIKGRENSRKRDTATIQWLIGNDWAEQNSKPEIHYKDIDSQEFKEVLWKNPNRAVEMVQTIPDKHCMILDIGGYFAPALDTLMNDEVCQKKLLGIIEDTENGHQHYQHALEKFKQAGRKPCPIYSVARAEIKKTEDYNVGKSIVQAADSMLRTEFNKYLENFECIGVIGFGKIGSSIAAHLRGMHVKKVLVYDINPNLAMIAASQDFNVATKDTLKKLCDFIFCATGNKSLNASDLKNFEQENVYIASCTSPDSEFDLEGATYNLAANEQQKPYDIYKFRVGQTQTRLGNKYRHVYMLAHGEAINFYQKAVVGPYIRCVQSGIMVAAIRLLYKEDEQANREYEIISLQPGTETKISQIWLQEFHEVYKDNTKNYLGIPKPNLSFVSREEDIARLAMELKLNSSDFKEFNNYKGAVIVTGDSGVGKTELVKEFINTSFIEDEKSHRFYDLIHWLDLDSPGLYEQFMGLTIKLSTGSGARTIAELTEIILAKLKYATNYLLIIDGIEDESKTELVQKFLSLIPNEEIYKDVGRRHIILLGKHIPDAIKNAGIKVYTVNNFTMDDSRIYVNKKFTQADLSKKQAITDNQINDIAALSDHFNTLVLEKTVAYIVNQNTTVNIDILLNRIKIFKKTDNSSIDSSKLALEDILKYIIEALKKAHESFERLICCLSLMPEKYISRRILEPLAQDLAIPNPADAITQLERYSILTLPQRRGDNDSKNDEFVFHKGVREALDSIIKARQIDVYTPVVNSLHKLFKYDYYLNDNNANFNYLQPYVKAIEEELIRYLEQNKHKSNNEIFEQSCEVLYRYALFMLYEARDYNGALLLFKKIKNTTNNSNKPEISHDSSSKLLNLYASLEMVICNNYLIKSGEVKKRHLFLMSTLPNEAEHSSYKNSYILVRKHPFETMAQSMANTDLTKLELYYIDEKGEIDRFDIKNISDTLNEQLKNIQNSPFLLSLQQKTLRNFLSFFQNTSSQNKNINDLETLARQHHEKEQEAQLKPLQEILEKDQFDAIWNNLLIAVNQEQIKTIEEIVKNLNLITSTTNNKLKHSINLIEAYITLSYSKRNLFDLTNDIKYLSAAAKDLDNASEKLADISSIEKASSSNSSTTYNIPNSVLILESAIEHARGGNYLAQAKNSADSDELKKATESFRIARDRRKEVIKRFRNNSEQDSKVLNSININSNYLVPNLARTYYKLAEAFFIAAKNNKLIIETPAGTPERAWKINKKSYDAADCLLKAKRYCTLAFDAQNSMFFGKSSSDFEQTRELLSKIKCYNLSNTPEKLYTASDSDTDKESQQAFAGIGKQLFTSPSTTSSSKRKHKFSERSDSDSDSEPAAKRPRHSL